MSPPVDNHATASFAAFRSRLDRCNLSGDTTDNPSLGPLVAWLERFRWLANAHVVDFFTRNHWEKFDTTWREALLPSTPPAQAESSTSMMDVLLDDCIQMASYGRVKEEWPASLRGYVQTARALASDRTPGSWPSPAIKEHILYGMNPKKVHEVERLAWAIAELAASREIGQIVDLGSGQGYLSRSLAYQYGLNVLAIDADNVQTCGAQRYQAQSERHGTAAASAAGDGAVAARGQLVHATHLVTEKSLHELQKAVLHSNSGDGSGRSSWLLCGLHACGDLSASSLRLFVESDAQALVNVGCCYNLLTEEEEEEEEEEHETATTCKQPGFPLSRWLTSAISPMTGSGGGGGAFIGLTGRHLACQAPGRWASQVDAVKTAFERNYYRALLHLFMVKHDMAAPDANAPQVGRSGRSPVATFEDYAMMALKRLLNRPGALSSLAPSYLERIRSFLNTGEVIEPPVDSPMDASTAAAHAACDDAQARCRATLRAFERSHALGRQQVAIFWTLRALLAPALERLILEDRLAYLREHGHAAWLVALFDPVASPRNLAIFSIK